MQSPGSIQPEGRAHLLSQWYAAPQEPERAATAAPTTGASPCFYLPEDVAPLLYFLETGLNWVAPDMQNKTKHMSEPIYPFISFIIVTLPGSAGDRSPQYHCCVILARTRVLYQSCTFQPLTDRSCNFGSACNFGRCALTLKPSSYPTHKSPKCIKINTF